MDGSELKPDPVASPAFSAAAAVAPDAITADLLAKHSAGEKLTASEYGKLGAWKSKLKGIFGGTNGAKPEPATSRLGASLGLGALAPGEAPGDGLGAVPPDPALCVRTTAAILRRVDVVTTKYVEREARAAFAGDERKVARFAASAALSADDRQLVADLSPDILSELGIDPGSYPFLTAAGILGAHACSLWLLVDELRKERVEREAAKGKESK